MKKIRSIVNFSISGIIFLLFLFFFKTSPIEAIWIKNPNPIFTRSFNSWDTQHVTNPIVINDGDVFKMWYVGSDGSTWLGGYAESPDGINEWTRKPTSSTPIVNVSGTWEKDITYTLVRKEATNDYKMWLIVAPSVWTIGVDRLRMAYATSSDGIVWNRHGGYFTGSSGKWDEGGIERGISIVKISDTYHLWYAGTDARDMSHPELEYWRIGYATSPDGVTWTKQNNENPVIEPTTPCELNNVSYPHVLYENGVFKMWYGASNLGIPTQFCYATSTDGINWNKEYENPVMTTGTFGSFDSEGIDTPRISHDPDGTYKMWYGGHGTYTNSYGPRWSIGYATNIEDPKSTAKDPVVIIPGMFASWSREAILEKNTGSTTWKMLPFIKEYDGIITTLLSQGYTKDKNLFLWPYDWRKSVGTITSSFDSFIADSVKPANPGKKINIVGHSLGGLVARSWAQTGSHKDDVKTLITVGTPNQGVIQPYMLWEGGAIPTDDSALAILGKMMIELNRKSLITSREIVQLTLPVLKDLLPVNPYLKRQSDDQLIAKSKMSVWNDWLANLNTQVSPVISLIKMMRGTGTQTPDTYTVSPPSWLDKGLGNWTDGKPVTTNPADGDNTVTSLRAILDGSTSFPLSKNHNELIASKDGIKLILDRLEIPIDLASITEGQTTNFRPSLLFLIRSPASFTVSCTGKGTINDIDGIVFIPDAQNGDCAVVLTGTGDGAYHLSVGQFTNTAEIWNEYADTISKDATKTYDMTIDQDHPKTNPLLNQTPEQLLQMIDVMLSDIVPYANKLIMQKTQFDLSLAKKAAQKKQLAILKLNIDHLFTDFSMLRRITPKSMDVRDGTLAINDLLISSYQSMFATLKAPFKDVLLKTLDKNMRQLDTTVTKQLQQKVKAGNNVKQQAFLYAKVEEYKNLLSQTPDSDNAQKYILLFHLDLTLREITF